MRLIAALLVSLFFCALADAQVLTLAEVKAKNGIQLSTEDLKKLMPDAKVVNRTVAGSTRNWNNGNGTFVASSDGKGVSMGKGAGATGRGTWHIDEGQATYCVTIDWPRIHEEWCRYIFKVGDTFYNFDELTNDNEQSAALEFTK